MSETELVTKYQELIKRTDQLNQRRAILQGREEERAKERELIRVQLLELGVDPDRPKEEEARLFKELQEDYLTAKGLIDQFEQELEEPSKAPIPPPNLPVPAVVVDPEPPKPPPVEENKPSPGFGGDIELS